MTDRLAAAQAALNAGRRPEAVEHLIAAIAENPARAAPVYRGLATQLYVLERNEEGEAYAARGLLVHPRDYELLNLRGVLLRRLRRPQEAVPLLEQAVKAQPRNPAAQQNLGNALLDLGQYARAEQVFTRLARGEPRNAEANRLLGRALARQSRIEPALTRLRLSVSIKPDHVDGWLDLMGLLNDENRLGDAEAALEAALAANPGEPRLLEGKILLLRRSARAREAEALIRQWLTERPDSAWLHHQLAVVVGDWDRATASTHFTRAVELEPARLDYAIALVESLERNRAGDEAANIEQAYQLARGLLPRKAEFTEATTKVLTEIFVRVCDFDALDALGDFASLGRAWAESGRHAALLKQLARVTSDEDRLELLDQHRTWGAKVAGLAARQPLARPFPRAPDGKVRLGLMSSDLRAHPVGYFAMPLFDHLDRERFEVFVYSYFEGVEDPVQQDITRKVTAYRWWPDVTARQAAQRIADDQLDILIELGGSTYMNKLEVMAFRSASIQASWLGYPHSAGLEAIDYLICDPHNVPPRPELLVEKPMLMPKSWIALGQRFFTDAVPIEDGLPEDRHGGLTYGTANNPHKYTREVLRTWARVVKATPGSRFAFIRPEGGSPSFRANIERQFAHEGVGAERIFWYVVRGAHLPYYNQVDITLDTFPLTGGTTTTEALWMGVPVVSLQGEAFYERLSASILTNSGVADHVATDLDGYVAIALDLAADRARRLDLRRTLRERMRQGPLGQTEQFARDFYDMIRRTVRG